MGEILKRARVTTFRMTTLYFVIVYPPQSAMQTYEGGGGIDNPPVWHSSASPLKVNWPKVKRRWPVPLHKGAIFRGLILHQIQIS